VRNEGMLFDAGEKVAKTKSAESFLIFLIRELNCLLLLNLIEKVLIIIKGKSFKRLKTYAESFSKAIVLKISYLCHVDLYYFISIFELI
jgi:hypothetical protein